MNNYKIKINLNQLRILEKALDIYMRIGIGQIECVAEALGDLGLLEIYTPLDVREKWFNIIKKELLGFASGASFGIPNPQVSDKAKIAYDMNKTIQKCISDTFKEKTIGVWSDGNILHLGSEPFIKIKKEDENVCVQCGGTKRVKIWVSGKVKPKYAPCAMCIKKGECVPCY